jgi:hypothetical protein
MSTLYVTHYVHQWPPLSQLTVGKPSREENDLISRLLKVLQRRT